MTVILVGIGSHVVGDRRLLVLLPSLGLVGGFRIGACEIANIGRRGTLLTAGRALAGGVSGLGFARCGFLS